jgi:hypothetical protein
LFDGCQLSSPWDEEDLENGNELAGKQRKKKAKFEDLPEKVLADIR